MPMIISGFSSLAQYCSDMKNGNSKLERSKACPHCQAFNLIKNGFYHRKAWRLHEAKGLLNPVPIQRYLCKSCKHTCSALPECIPPRRWYLWDIQSDVLKTFIEGQRYRAIAKACLPTRNTIARWVKRFKSQWQLYADHFRQYRQDICSTSTFGAFWTTLLNSRSLASAMCSCHHAGIAIP